MNNLQLSRFFILMSYFGLLLLVALWQSILSPPSPNLISLKLFLYGGPLLLALRGILHDKIYTYGWATFLALFYFIHGSVEAYSSVPDRWLAITETGLSTLLFFSLIANIRCRKAIRLAKAEQNSTAQ